MLGVSSMPSFIMVEECFRQADYSIKTEGEPSQGWKNYRTNSVCHSDRWNVNRLSIEKAEGESFFVAAILLLLR